MSDTNCPFCGCEIAPFREKGDVIRYSCRNPLVPNSAPRGPLCREREAHNQTKRERDEARESCKSIVERANELIARWDQPSWKDTAPTAGYINALRNAVEAYEKTPK
jgi:hypothetical protein